jgi:hypothetical protein
MDVGEEADEVRDLVLVLGGKGERSGHISRLRDAQSRSRPCYFLGLREREHDLENSPVVGEVNPAPVRLSNLAWGSVVE